MSAHDCAHEGQSGAWVAELRGPLHARIQTLRGMCTDERPHVEIDAKLAELDDRVYELQRAIEEGQDAVPKRGFPMTTICFHEGQEVVYRFKRGIRYGMSKQELRCVVVNPWPFTDEWNGEPRLCVRCIEPDDPMNGHEFVPFVAALEVR